MKNGNKPAHPLSGIYYQDKIGRGVAPEDYQGLTKRELFAMAAMQGMLSNPQLTGNTCNEIACYSVLHADELLKQLES